MISKLTFDEHSNHQTEMITHLFTRTCECEYTNKNSYLPSSQQQFLTCCWVQNPFGFRNPESQQQNHQIEEHHCAQTHHIDIHFTGRVKKRPSTASSEKESEYEALVVTCKQWKYHICTLMFSNFLYTRDYDNLHVVDKQIYSIECY